MNRRDSLSLPHDVLQDTKDRVPKSEGYLNRTFPGAKKRGDEGGGEEGRSDARMHTA